jgi:hypothetical protein
MKYSAFIYIIISILICLGWQNTNKIVAYSSKSMYYNVKNKNKDRIYFFDKTHYIWVYESEPNDSILTFLFGNYKINSDSKTIEFLEPDSLEQENRFFCFCKHESDKKKEFHLHPDMSEKIYDEMFESTPPKYIVIHATRAFKGNFYSDTLEIPHKKSKYLLMKPK